MMLPEAAELCQLTIRVDHEVVQDEDLLAIQDGLVLSAYDERSIKSSLKLHGFVKVGVIPERARIGRREGVTESLTGLHRALNILGSVHHRWHAESVPVDHRRLRHIIGEMNFQRNTLPRFDHRAGNLSIKCIGMNLSPRSVLPVGFLSIQVYTYSPRQRLGFC